MYTAHHGLSFYVVNIAKAPKKEFPLKMVAIKPL